MEIKIWLLKYEINGFSYCIDFFTPAFMFLAALFWIKKRSNISEAKSSAI
jgi:hypothetical protein